MPNKIKPLIVSNNALEMSNSNGRTMINMLYDIHSENIASFYIKGNNDFNICKNCYNITDREACIAFFNRRKFKKIMKNKTEKLSYNGTLDCDTKEIKIKKNCRNLVLRDIIWKSYRWWTEEFDDFIERFNPNIIIFQAGDAPFMYYISLKIAKKYNLPIIVFNTENYVLKKQLYSSIYGQFFWHKILQKKLKKVYGKISEKAYGFIYSTEYLQKEFSKVYPCKSEVIYCSTDMPLLEEIKHEGFIISYIGNLGVGRDKPLMEIAKILSDISDKARLNIYGKFTSEKIKNAVCSFTSVNYCGVIPYDQVCFAMRKSDLLLHCESAEELEDLKGAFSTKIADSLASGIPFLVYADRRYPFVQYLENGNAAFIAENENEFKSIVIKCIENDSFRRKHVVSAYELSQKNHNKITNSNKMYEILKEVIKEKTDE